MASLGAHFFERVSHTRGRGCFRRASHRLHPTTACSLWTHPGRVGRCDACLHRRWLGCRPSHSPGRAEAVSAGRLGNIRLDHRTHSLAGAWRQIETLSLCVAIRVSWIALSGSSLNVLGVRRLHWLCLTGSRSPRRMLPCHFPVALACYGGDRRRDRGQAASVTAPALGPVIPHLPAPGYVPPSRVWPVSPVPVSDTRSKHLNQEDSINGYQQ